MAPYWRSAKPNIPRNEARRRSLAWLFLPTIWAGYIFGMGSWRAVHLFSIIGSSVLGFTAGVIYSRLTER